MAALLHETPVGMYSSHTCICSVHGAYGQCARNAVCIACAWRVHGMPTACMQAACKLHTSCMQGAFGVLNAICDNEDASRGALVS